MTIEGERHSLARHRSRKSLFAESARTAFNRLNRLRNSCAENTQKCITLRKQLMHADAAGAGCKAANPFVFFVTLW
jgi:hypothetical protein